MYVRIARFDAGERDWDEFADGVRETVRNSGRGTPIESVAGAITRIMLLADREAGRGANIILSETEEDIRRIDEAFNAITPVPGRGPRTSVEIFEVLMDEAPPK